MVTWKRVGAVAAVMVLWAGATAYAGDRNNDKDKDQKQPRQLIVLSASVDRRNDSITLKGQNFGSQAPMVYCETHPLTVLQNSDGEVVVWFPGSAPQGTYLFTVIRGRGHSELERNIFYVTTPAVATSGGEPGPQGPAGERGAVGGSPPAGSAPAGTSSPVATATPAGSTTTFEAPPGQVQFSIQVKGARGQVIDSMTRELTLPDYTKVEVSFGTARLFRARTVRDLSAIKANPAAIPTADREFSRTERLLIRVDAYTPGGIAPAVTARLLNRGGQKMSDLPVPAPAANAPFELELPLAALPVGDYLIEFNAKSDSGTAQEIVAFKIGR